MTRSEEEYDKDDELDIIDPRCIIQLSNALLGRVKGRRGRRSNKQKREDRVKEKGIISVIDFMKRSKGGKSSLGDP